MWPDDITKSNPIFLKKVSPKVATAVLLNFCQFLNSQKVTRNLGNFCKKNCHAELLKIAQSGHSALHLLLSSFRLSTANASKDAACSPDGAKCVQNRSPEVNERVRPVLETREAPWYVWHHLHVLQWPYLVPSSKYTLCLLPARQQSAQWL